jgi:Ca2+-binding RTX toxin-like protein
MELSYSRVIDANSSAYANLLFPAGVGNRDTTYEQGSVTITNGTSGNDTVNLNTSSTNVLYQGLAGNDDITLSDANSGYLVFGGAGDDIIKDSNDSGRSTLLDGGEGDDILSSDSQHSLKMTGGAGNDVFVIEYNSASYKWDSGNAFEGNDNNQDGILNFDEYHNIQGIITDFQDGSDKIGLRGSDWSGKTIVVQQVQ